LAVTCTNMGVRAPARLGAAAGQGEAHLPRPRLCASAGPEHLRARRDGSEAADPVVLLSIGRKVEKKGFGDLLDALALLPKTLHWRFEHIGAGELSDALKAQAERLGIAQRCTWLGAQPQKQVFAALARADLFVLASKKAADGDQGRLPNVLMEAAHQGLAIVSTRAAAIGEFIEDGNNGLLVPPGAPARWQPPVAAHDRPSRSAPAVRAPRRRDRAQRASPSTPASTGSPRRWPGCPPGGQSGGGHSVGGQGGGVTMRVLLHTPLKSPDSPIPRAIARWRVASGDCCAGSVTRDDAGAEPRPVRVCPRRRIISRSNGGHARGRGG